MTDEFYGLFLELIATGRDMDLQTVTRLADGRIYTAGQALNLGLIDEIGSWQSALEQFEAITGVSAYFPDLSAETTFMSQLLMRGVFQNKTTGIPLPLTDTLPRGVPLAIAPELFN
jgi:protease-4